MAPGEHLDALHALAEVELKALDVGQVFAKPPGGEIDRSGWNPERVARELLLEREVQVRCRQSSWESKANA